ncbi:hypothetical protein KBY97_10405 [Synechococcus sp. ATX 2A4]|uniref:hypothetical protein n=1 Tax=Synechococcus sp. ATX 2A4 TaxID=2823727 RepID=UPI0020CBE19C|nr:hypothetical protein [Synechococcus sp. ATX 2A4]MCP9885530.1 hypothetical protein [Synechococcus sp. ATX 2A4]
MGQRSSCRSCRHCSPPSGESMGWCHLRRLDIHQELASDLWCHHWTARSPRLPASEILSYSHPHMGGAPVIRQLALTDLLPTTV